MKLSRFFPKSVRDYLCRIRAIVRNLRYERAVEKFTEKALDCTESGVSDADYGNELILSLTTYGRRLQSVHLAIESIMQGTVLPNRIILWLEEELKGTPLPSFLQRQMKRGLEVAFCKNVRSYKKLYPALCHYPDSDIITIDDDVMYKYDLVESLVNAHKEHCDCVVARRTHRIVMGTDGLPVPYSQWGLGRAYERPTFLNFFTGVGGVFYPARSLDNEVVREDVFTDICPLNDDIWFNAMAVKKNTRVVRVRPMHPRGEGYIVNEEVQDMGLCNVNVGQGLNDRQIRAVFGRYHLNDILAAEQKRMRQEDGLRVR